MNTRTQFRLRTEDGTSSSPFHRDRVAERSLSALSGGYQVRRRGRVRGTPARPTAQSERDATQADRTSRTAHPLSDVRRAKTVDPRCPERPLAAAVRGTPTAALVSHADNTAQNADPALRRSVRALGRAGSARSWQSVCVSRPAASSRPGTKPQLVPNPASNWSQARRSISWCHRPGSARPSPGVGAPGRGSHRA
jgi:hypothetical protein